MKLSFCISRLNKPRVKLTNHTNNFAFHRSLKLHLFIHNAVLFKEKGIKKIYTAY